MCLCRQWSSSAAAAQVLEASPTKDWLQSSGSAGCGASGLATCWHTSLKESQGFMSDMKTNPSMKILSPQWHFSLYSSSSSCLEASLVVAGVKEAVQLPLSNMWTKAS